MFWRGKKSKVDIDRQWGQLIDERNALEERLNTQYPPSNHGPSPLDLRLSNVSWIANPRLESIAEVSEMRITQCEEALDRRDVYFQQVKDAKSRKKLISISRELTRLEARQDDHAIDELNDHIDARKALRSGQRFVRSFCLAIAWLSAVYLILDIFGLMSQPTYFFLSAALTLAVGEVLRSQSDAEANKMSRGWLQSLEKMQIRRRSEFFQFSDSEMKTGMRDTSFDKELRRTIRHLEWTCDVAVAQITGRPEDWEIANCDDPGERLKLLSCLSSGRRTKQTFLERA